MKKVLPCLILSIFCITVCYSKEKATSGNNLEKQSLSGLAQMELNTESNSNAETEMKIPAQDEKDYQFWQKQLSSPLLDQAKKEKEAEEKAVTVKQKTILHKVLFYIPNRILDLTDIFSFRLGFGPEASFVLSFTKWFEFGGSYGDNYFIENGYNRQYGGGYHGGYSVSAGWAGWNQNYTDYTFGYTRPYVINEQQGSIILSPSEKVYKNGTLDFWKIGVHAGWLANFGFEIHPAAVANFFTGFFFIRLTDTEEL